MRRRRGSLEWRLLLLAADLLGMATNFLERRLEPAMRRTCRLVGQHGELTSERLMISVAGWGWQ